MTPAPPLQQRVSWATAVEEEEAAAAAAAEAEPQQAAAGSLGGMQQQAPPTATAPLRSVLARPSQPQTRQPPPWEDALARGDLEEAKRLFHEEFPEEEEANWEIRGQQEYEEFYTPEVIAEIQENLQVTP